MQKSYTSAVNILDYVSFDLIPDHKLAQLFSRLSYEEMYPKILLLDIESRIRDAKALDHL